MTRRVLVAEDDPNILISLEFLLKNAGHAVTTAASGDTAWRLIEGEGETAPPDLVVLV